MNFGRRLLSAILIMIGVALLSIAFWPQSKSVATVEFLAVGQGDATLITSPTGRRVLIDGGPDKSVLLGLGDSLGYWRRHLEAVILTHPHDDHLFGLLEVIKRYQVGNLLSGSGTSTENSYTRWLNDDAPHRLLTAGDRLELGPDESITVINDGLASKDLNDRSLVLRYVYKDFSVLLMGDAGADIEPLISATSTIIKIGHHGSDYGSGETFLKTVAPELAIISVGKNNYGHPSPRVINRLKRLNIPYQRTDVAGAVKLESDGSGFTILK